MPEKPTPKFSAETLKERLRLAEAAVEQAVVFAHRLDWLGDVEKHPDGSDEQRLASIRDEVDFALAQFFRATTSLERIRAEDTRCLDLLLPAAISRRGDGHDALRLMRRYHELFGDESEANGEVIDSTFPDEFAWETYLRVSALSELVDEFPEHLKHSARQMHGWPMIVSHHVDCLPEFRRIAERLNVGANYPLEVGPRRKRGTETPMLRYLEPMVWRLFVLHGVLVEAAMPAPKDANPEQLRWRPAPIPADDEGFAKRIQWCWWGVFGPKPGSEELAILRRLPSLPPLTRKTARVWSREVIVPLILLDDAGTAETCGFPALRNIWRHRSVKSRATFKSRLHSAVTDTLERFGRPD